MNFTHELLVTEHSTPEMVEILLRSGYAFAVDKRQPPFPPTSRMTQSRMVRFNEDAAEHIRQVWNLRAYPVPVEKVELKELNGC